MFLGPEHWSSSTTSPRTPECCQHKLVKCCGCYGSVKAGTTAGMRVARRDWSPPPTLKLSLELSSCSCKQFPLLSPPHTRSCSRPFLISVFFLFIQPRYIFSHLVHVCVALLPLIMFLFHHVSSPFFPSCHGCVCAPFSGTTSGTVQSVSLSARESMRYCVPCRVS